MIMLWIYSQLYFWLAVTVVVAAARKDVSFLVNGVEMEDGNTFEYDNTRYNITCSSNLDDNSTSLALAIIRSRHSENVEGALLEKPHYKSIHTLDPLHFSGNITRISCFLIESDNSDKEKKYLKSTKSTDFVRKSERSPSKLSSTKPNESDCSSHFQTHSFAIGISTGIVIGILVTILLGLLCRFTIYRPPKPPRPRMPSPLPDPEYYSIVYSWRKRVLPPLLPRVVK